MLHNCAQIIFGPFNMVCTHILAKRLTINFQLNRGKSTIVEKQLHLVFLSYGNLLVGNDKIYVAFFTQKCHCMSLLMFVGQGCFFVVFVSFAQSLCLTFFSRSCSP